MDLELGFGIAQRRIIDLTVGVGDPHELGYLRYSVLWMVLNPGRGAEESCKLFH